LTSEYEGYGMTLIEALAASCPIVTTKVGIAKTDLFKDGVNSFVCPVGDVDCLSKKIILKRLALVSLLC
jgi:glycosyltransferase involved in cell wall biosynthesis